MIQFFSTHYLHYKFLNITFNPHPISVEKMKLLEQNSNEPGKLRLIHSSGFLPDTNKKAKSFFKIVRSTIIHYHDSVRYLGVTDSMDEAMRRRVSLLNQINILHFITCLIIPFLTLTNNQNISFISLGISLAPCIVSILVLSFNAAKRYNVALLSYFILYPFCTCLIYLDGMNLGMGLYFIMYGILAVFFLQEISHMIFFIAFTMISYFMLEVVLKDYTFKLETANPQFYYFNQLVAIFFIFYGLYLIKRENSGYQTFILQKNEELNEANLIVEKKNKIINEKANQLEKQTIQLTDINAFQTKLFSIISHDLRAPVYALRDLFQSASEKKMSTAELEELIPDVATDLSYTAELMENLLQWAKSQMQTGSMHPQKLDVGVLVNDVTQLLRLQAEAKKVLIEANTENAALAYADRDMIHLVIRNLLSNAIKFTAEGGKITISVHRAGSVIKVTIKDTGMGMSEETLTKINRNNFFSTKGTANESGTGLGLMLCKEFLIKNGGRLSVESKEGRGSTFSFTLPVI